MNELAVKAANGTNALSDRQTIQDEVTQLLTEIDRVAETTKFNEIYLLKGDANRVEKYLAAKDAGIEGQLQDGATRATFTMNALKFGDSITIGNKQYQIGMVGNDGAKAIAVTIEKATAGELVTIDGVQYTVAADDAQENADKNVLTSANIAKKIVGQSTVLYMGKTYHVMKDEMNTNGTPAAGGDKIDDVDASVITAEKAYEMIQEELRLANSVGANKTQASVAARKLETNNNNVQKAVFSITQKGIYTAQEDLNFSLHVGADADMTNKINVNIQAMDTKGLGIDGLTVKNMSGSYATYAIDSIAEAIAKVSQQRSMIGAVQNRLEHTINNLDNVVENTTAAESQIRDTDMATEMVKYSNSNILQQAGQSMLAQSNQANQGVLSLLQ